MSNLLQKASIVTTPTAYGVGVLNSIKPAIPFGEELIVNGSFNTSIPLGTSGSGWSTVIDGTNTVAYSNGGVKLTRVNTSECKLYANTIGGSTTVLTSGKKYKLTYQVLSVTSNPVLRYFNGGGYVTVSNEIGFHSLNFVQGATGLSVFYNTTDNTDITIDNVSIKEKTDADFDFTRTSSATRVNPDYLIETSATNTPRLDYTNGTASILLENQSTNVIGNSENLIDGGAGWINQLGGTVDDNQFSEISGKNDAWKLNKASGTFKSLRLQQTLSSSTYTLSWYLKQGNINKAQFRFDGGLGAQYVLFDLLEGTHTDNANLDNIQINSAGGGWYRCQATITTNLTNVHLYIDDSTVSSAAGYIYAQYPQIEALTYSTSYIATSGSAVTRAAETLNNAANSDLINSTEGVLYAEIAGKNDGTFNYISLSDGGTTNYAGILYTDNNNEIIYRYYGAGTQIAITVSISDLTSFNKIAVKWKVNDFAIWINGVEVGSASSGAVHSSGVFDNLSFARGGSNNTPFYGNCKTVAVFSEALSDTELACLTSTNNREIFLNYYYRMQYVGANTEALSCAEQTFNI